MSRGGVVRASRLLGGVEGAQPETCASVGVADLGRPTSRGEEREERGGSGSGWLRKKVRARGREISEYTCRQFRFVSCQCSGRTERGRRCMRRIIIRGGARGWSREHGRTFPMVSVERLCRWTNRFSSSWSQPWAEGCGEGAGKRRVRRRDRRPCGTPRISMRNKKASRNAEPPPESGGVRARRARRRSFGGSCTAMFREEVDARGSGLRHGCSRARVRTSSSSSSSSSSFTGGSSFTLLSGIGTLPWTSVDISSI